MQNQFCKPQIFPLTVLGGKLDAPFLLSHYLSCPTLDKAHFLAKQK